MRLWSAVVCTSLLAALSAALPACADHSRFLEYVHQADRATDEGNLAESEALYGKALKEEPGSAVAHNNLGLCFERENRLLEAAGQFNAALAINPNYTASLHNLGSVLYRQGRYDDAIAKYKQVLQLKQGNDAEAQTNLASVLRDRATFSGGATRDTDYQQAIEHFRKALELKPDFEQAHNNLGLCYMRLRRFDDAEAEIRRAIALKPDYAAAYFNLGLIEQARNNAQKALEAFQTSLRHETVPMYQESTRRKIKELGLPSEVEDHFSHGFDLLVARQWKQAEDELRQAVSGAERDNGIAWNNLGVAQFNQGKYADSVDSYKTANKLKAKFIAARYNLGQALRLCGDKNGAEANFRQALKEAGGTHALAHNALGIVLKDKGDSQGALSHYKLAILQSGDTLPVVHYNLGLLLATHPETREQALEEFRLYVSHAPSGLNVATAKANIQRLSQ